MRARPPSKSPSPRPWRKSRAKGPRQRMARFRNSSRPPPLRKRLRRQRGRAREVGRGRNASPGSRARRGDQACRRPGRDKRRERGRRQSANNRGARDDVRETRRRRWDHRDSFATAPNRRKSVGHARELAARRPGRERTGGPAGSWRKACGTPCGRATTIPRKSRRCRIWRRSRTAGAAARRPDRRRASRLWRKNSPLWRPNSWKRPRPQSGQNRRNRRAI